MKCPNCGHGIKDEGRAKGGRKSRRTITSEQQAKMQAARKRIANQKAALRKEIFPDEEW